MRIRWQAASVLALIALAVALSAQVATSQETYPVTPALEGNRGPLRIVFAPDGKRAYVTEYDEGAVSAIDVASGNVLHSFASHGEEPVGVAVTPDGGTLIVVNSFSGSVAFLNAADGKLLGQIPLRGMPWDVLVSKDGATAWVSVSQLDRVAVIEVATRQVKAMIPTGYRPRAMALSPNGNLLWVVNQTEGSVSIIDTAQGREVRRGRTPAVNARGIALSADGRFAYVTAQRAQNERPTETPIGIWSNQLFIITAGGGLADNIWLDLVGKQVSDPDGIVQVGNRVLVACAGGHSVNSLAVDGGPYAAKTAKAVGANPRSLAVSPDGKQVWVSNHLGNSISVLNPETLAVERTIPLRPTSRKDPTLLGRFLFSSAHIVKGAQFSCNSCHTDGNMDGISWKFTHVKDGVDERNVRNLRGELQATAPFRWSGHNKDLPEFIREEAEGLLQGPKLTDEHVDAMAKFIESLKMPANPHRSADGSLTDAAKRGLQLFNGKAGCGSCHSGGQFGGTGKKANVGTTPDELQLDVPHLAGVYDTAPYLHNGKARNLEEIFTTQNAKQRHGLAHTLTPEELKDLIQFVREQ